MFLNNKDGLLITEEEALRQFKKLFIFLVVSLLIYCIYFTVLSEVSNKEPVKDIIYKASIERGV